VRLLFLFVAFTATACGAGAHQDGAASSPDEGLPFTESDVDDAAYKFYRSVARTLLRTDQPLQAAENIRRLFKLKPKSPEPSYLMGQAYVAMEQYDFAIKMFDQAIDRDRKYAPAYSMKGVVLNNLGRHQEANEAHLRAIRVDEENASYYNNLGFSYYLQGDYKQAVISYLDAINVDPGDKRVHNNLGFAYGKLGKLKSALRHFKLAGTPDQANNNLGFVFEVNGHPERAYEYYVVALKQNPDLVQAQKNLQRVCGILGRVVPDFAVRYDNVDGGEADASTPDS
jgi:Flp pilus assembly protein TadD